MKSSTSNAFKSNSANVSNHLIKVGGGALHNIVYFRRDNDQNIDATIESCTLALKVSIVVPLLIVDVNIRLH